MWKLLANINKNLVLAIPISMLLGFVFGLFGPQEYLPGFIIPMTFVMVYPMMTTLRLKNILKQDDLKTQLITLIVNFAIVPFVALGIGTWFFSDKPYFLLGLFLASLLPTSGMTISWTGFAKGNLEAAVKMTVLGLTIGSLVTPFYLKVFMGESIQFEILSVLKQIVIIVFIPMLLGHITRTYFVKKYSEPVFKEKYAKRFSSFSTIGVLGIVFIAIGLKAQSLLHQPFEILYICGPACLLYLINYALSTFIGKLFLARENAIALVYGSVMRNLSIALAIALNSFGKAGPEIALVITVAFILQVQSAAWYVKFTNTFFGPPKNAA